MSKIILKQGDNKIMREVGNKMKSALMLGVNPNAEREENDFYATSPNAIISALPLLKECGLDKNVFECACVDSKTEYFNGYKWQYISEFQQEDKVLCYEPKTQQATLLKPIKYIKIKTDDFLHLYDTSYLSMALTDDHKVLYKNYLNKAYEVDVAKNIFNTYHRDSNGFRGKIPTTFKYNNDLEINEYFMRIAVACNADGCLRTKSGKYEIRVKKTRKYDRLKYLLEHAGISYDYSFSNEYHRFYFQSPYGNKDFPIEWINLTDNLKKAFIDEVTRWDGSILHDGVSRYYYSTNKHNVDVVQMIAHSIGLNAKVEIDKRKNPNYKTGFRVSFLRNSDFALSKAKNTNYKLIKSADGYKYCFTTKTGFLILRRNNKIFITGNCGQGDISKVLIENGYNVYSSDLIDRGFGDVQNFLTREEKWNGDILTNPPFKLAEEFVKKGIELIDDGNKVFLFLKVQFLESKKRKELFKQYPLKHLLVYSERQLCAKNGEFEKYTSTTQCYCWFVFEKGYSGKPDIDWI